MEAPHPDEVRAYFLSFTERISANLNHILYDGDLVAMIAKTRCHKLRGRCEPVGPPQHSSDPSRMLSHKRRQIASVKEHHQRQIEQLAYKRNHIRHYKTQTAKGLEHDHVVTFDASNKRRDDVDYPDDAVQFRRYRGHMKAVAGEQIGDDLTLCGHVARIAPEHMADKTQMKNASLDGSRS